MKLTKVPFNQIVRGTKTIESRLFDEKRQGINLGDNIEFSENEDSTRKILTKVKGLIRYQTFKEMFTDYDISLFGGEDLSSLTEQIHQFYSTEDEQKYGVLGIRIELIA